MNDFEIKEIYGKDTIEYKKICVYAFRAENKELTDEKQYAEMLERQEAENDKNFIRLGAYYSGKLCAAIELIPFDVFIDGKTCSMCGIGGVVSQPECPKRGAVKLLFRHAFEYMREKGMLLSHLYPFEINYYRQYGYEVSCTYADWNIPLRALPKKTEGVCKSFDNSEKMRNEIIGIYNGFARNYNMLYDKNEKQWNEFFNSHDAYVSGYFSYVHYTEDKADAYMCYRIKEYDSRPMDLIADKVWFLSYDGLRGVISYFNNQKAYADSVILRLPEHTDISAIIDSNGGWGKKNAVKSVWDYGTSRIVDAEKFLKCVKYKGSGNAVVKINDDYCLWNNDCFSISFGEKTTVVRGGVPDIELDIAEFSSLILGRYDFSDFRIFPGIKVYGNEENLKKIFYKKKCYIEEHF